ncbi:hypothetical protein SARC_08433 [Sphaeroforma arctica JP610]|uniref:protein disulfide-isomerase n=1 Tax=Sphaeroforma arctica JP610 TaxID=667725 RepID=A0A0L0FR62_9EUKA|nr:hypothetical protein SARC_08433 [Sphaeroforma arctica JP610]KNC79169.1 hypothetical protein SARC_08433 [Sphaeroforma arctica JP610]|eukprot:XP_014153071.1 hypothetical protein SARC_08433 [Sphaeroforma arctica JP610]
MNACIMPIGEAKEPEEYNGGRGIRELTEFLTAKGFAPDEFSELEMMAGLDLPEPDEHNVYHLNDDNFDDFIDDHDIVLVAFTAAWCGHCKKLHPEWNEAAKYLAKENSEAKLAWIDAAKNKEIADDYDITSYPTLKYFRHGIESDYHLGTETIEIVSFLSQQSGPPAMPIDSVKEYDDVVTINNVVTFGVFSDLDSEEAQVFVELAAGSIGKFCITKNAGVKEKLGLSPDVEQAVVLIKNFDDGRAEYDGALDDVVQLKAFVKEAGVPLVIEYTESVMNMIFENDVKTHVLLFHDDKGSLDAYAQCFAEVARKQRGEMLFVTVAIPDEHSSGPVKYFQVQPSDKVVIRAVTTEPENTRYYPVTNDITCDTIASFVQDFADGKIEPQKKEPKPDEDENDYKEADGDEDAEWDGSGVKVLTKDTFHAFVKDPSRDVFVLMYADWCGHCKAMKPAFNELAAMYEDVDDVVIAKINADTSRPEGVAIDGFPTLKLYSKKSGEPVEYMGQRKAKDMAKFLASEVRAEASPACGETESGKSAEADTPLVWAFRLDNEDALFAGPTQMHYLLFHTDEGLSELKECFTEASKKYRTYMHFVTVDKMSEVAATPMKFFGLTPNTKADLRLISSTNADTYVPTEEVTCALFAEYAQSFVDGKLVPISDEEGHGHSHDDQHGHSNDGDHGHSHDSHDEL